MVLEFIIVGGYIKLDRNVFIKEMLIKDSRLKSLLNWGTVMKSTNQHVSIDEDEQSKVLIDFSGTSSVTIGESPKELLGELKAKYKEKFKGKVVCRGTYGICYSFELDLNSDDEKIEYKMG